ncbi:MAG: formylglycine-generating enzyme family protein, partial [Proteobacteria bacterium]|nr:formylglycine-generating enzyme family protein [Pseudomonadota bacterium]
RSTVGWNPSEFGPNGSYSECGLDCPVEGVSWYDAVAYANELSKDASLTPCYILSNVFCEKGATRTDATNYMACFDGSEAMSGGITSATVELNGVTSVYDCEGYRLPTEAEWEYAARAGTTTAFYNGGITNTDRIPLDPNLDAIGWYGGNSSYKSGGWACRGYHSGATYCGPQPVGGKPANAFGLCDMSGNVWEWVWDWYESSYPEGNTSSPVEDPTGPTSAPTRVARGGGWNTYASLCRAARRSNPSPRGRHFSVGFRLARSLP